MWKITLPERKYTGRVFGRKKPRVSARLEVTEGFPDYYPHMRVCAGAGAHVPFYTLNPSVPSIINKKSYQLSINKRFWTGRVVPSTLTPPFRRWKGERYGQLTDSSPSTVRIYRDRTPCWVPLGDLRAASCNDHPPKPSDCPSTVRASEPRHPAAYGQLRIVRTVFPMLASCARVRMCDNCITVRLSVFGFINEN